MPIKQTAAVRFLYQGFTVHRTCKRWADAGAGPDVVMCALDLADSAAPLHSAESLAGRRGCATRSPDCLGRAAARTAVQAAASAADPSARRQ